MLRKPFFLSVKVMIRNKEDSYLVLKRSPHSKANAGKWEMPGGKIDPGETFEEALLREVVEETSLEITLEHAVGMAETELSEKKIVYLILEGCLASGEVSLSSEHTEYAWVERSKLPEVDMAEYFRPFIRNFCS